jgi:predicted nucleic acid-binding protein
MIVVDSNILIDVLGVDQEWQPWSRHALQTLSASGRDLVINTVVLAEIAGNAPDLPALLQFLTAVDIEVLTIDADSAFLAGQVFRSSRRDRDELTGAKAILADFLIGAHAVIAGASLLTRDPRLYRRYFPDLSLITPETHP